MTGSNAGASWKARRESMGKTLEDAANTLRISRRYLQGIEEGHYEDWPERVFASGFIRTYAKYLGVEPGPVLAEYEGRHGEEKEPESPTPAPRPEWLEREHERGNRKTVYIAAAGLVLLLGVVLAVFSMRGTEQPAPAPVGDNAALPPAAEVPPAPVAADNAGGAPPDAFDNVVAVRTTEPAPGGPATAPAGAQTASGDNAAAPPPANTLVAGAPGPLTGPFQLFLEAGETTWVMYTRDDGDPIDVTLFMGDKISIQAERRITLKIGNAGGVVGTLNGQRLPPFGERGQVRNVSFGK